ncbi:MAG: NAD(P)-binding domain-containing protein [Flavobacterium sp.]
MNVHIIGGGNLGTSIAIGISKFSKNNQVTITRRNTASIAYLENLGIAVSSDNTYNIEDADVVILTVKPYQVDIVLADILPKITNKTIASAVSGLSIEVLQSKIGVVNHEMLIMHNIESRFGESATCF